MRAPRCFGSADDREHRLRRGLEQQIVDHGLVLVGDVANRRRQREDDVEVGNREQFGSRAAIQSRAAAPWHFGQCRLRQLL